MCAPGVFENKTLFNMRELFVHVYHGARVNRSHLQKQQKNKRPRENSIVNTQTIEIQVSKSKLFLRHVRLL